MHILQLLPALAVGGVERGVIDSARVLVRRGHRVTVISSGGPLVKVLEAAGAQHITMPVDRKHLCSILECIPLVERFIENEAVDIVHARSRVPGWIAWRAAKKTQRPFVTTAHGFYSKNWGSQVMMWGRYVIAPSEALARYLMENFKVPRQRIRVIPRSVDTELFAFTEGRKIRRRVGLFGRLTRIKGHDVAIRACSLLAAKGQPIELYIAGDTPGALRDELQSLVKTLGVEAYVHWLGVRNDIAKQIAKVDVVCVPSVYPESFGRGVIEAQAVGRPVVASRIGALPDLIEEEQTGLLVPANDPEALAAAIERFMQDSVLRERCVGQGRALVEREWSVTRMVDRTLEIYDACLNRPHVVVWKLSALGDVILSIPGLRALRKHYPKSRITLIVGCAFYEVVARCPYVDDIILFDAKGKHRGFLGRLEFARELRLTNADISIDLQNSRASHWMAWLAGIRTRVGYNRKMGRWLNRRYSQPKGVLAPVRHLLYLLKQAGIESDGEHLELWIDDEAEKAADTWVEKQKRAPIVVGMHPGGSQRWKTKRWDLERWAEVCDRLAEAGAKVVVTGGPEELQLGSELTRRTQSTPEMAIGQTSILELAALIRRCDVFMAHDSAALHLAAAVGTPTIAFFGPTDPVRHLPPAFEGKVLRKPLFCSPCYATRCRIVTHACMKEISVEEVLRSLQALVPQLDISRKPTQTTCE